MTVRRIGHLPGFFAKLRRLRIGEIALLGEAMVLILLAAPAVRGMPFTRLADIASLRLRRPAPPPERARALSATVGWAIWVVAKRSPFRALCFEQGLVAQVMLRRRGIDSTLFYGARIGAARLDAHVWVLSGGRDVAGSSNATDFAVLASFPRGREALGHRIVPA